MRFPSISRLCLEKKLRKELTKLKRGSVLYVGTHTNRYEEIIPNTEFITMDIDKKLNPDIVSDIHSINIKNKKFDTVVATQVLEHCYNPEKAVSEMHRILKSRGTMVISVPFIFPYHPCPNDYFRFTSDGLRHLARKFKEIEIIPIGNRFLSIWQLMGYGRLKILFHLLNPLISLLDFSKNTKTPLGYIVIARK